MDRQQPRPTSTEITAYHAMDEVQIDRSNKIREATANLIDVIEVNTPPCADRSAAVRKVREAMMTANAAIALKGAI